MVGSRLDKTRQLDVTVCTGGGASFGESMLLTQPDEYRSRLCRGANLPRSDPCVGERRRGRFAVPYVHV